MIIQIGHHFYLLPSAETDLSLKNRIHKYSILKRIKNLNKNHLTMKISI